jgi:hypothetical protein
MIFEKSIWVTENPNFYADLKFIEKGSKRCSEEGKSKKLWEKCKKG